MSQQNAEIMRALVAHWNAGERLPAVAAYFDPAFELESPFSSVVGEPYRGHEGIERWTRDVDEQFAEWRINLDEVREVGNAVVAIGAIHGKGRVSGIVVESPAAFVAHFGTDHCMRRARIYWDVTEALEAVGLAE